MGDRMFRVVLILIYSLVESAGIPFALFGDRSTPMEVDAEFGISKPIGTIILPERLYSGPSARHYYLKLHYNRHLRGLSVGQGSAFGNTYYNFNLFTRCGNTDFSHLMDILNL